MDVESRNVFPHTQIGRDHQVRDAFRNGMVIERKFDPERGPLVRVQYMDRQQLISYWLPVKQFGSRTTGHYYSPKVGDHVNVNMLQNGSENGFVDGSFYNKKNPPPQVDIDTRHFFTEDGTIIEYREIDSTFNLNASAAGSGARAGAGGTVLVSAGLVQVTATEMIVLTAPVIQLNGFVQHTGDMVTSGVHTDSNGIHMGARSRERDLEAEVDRLNGEVRELNAEVAGLKDRFWALEAKVRKGTGE